MTARPGFPLKPTKPNSKTVGPIKPLQGPTPVGQNEKRFLRKCPPIDQDIEGRVGEALERRPYFPLPIFQNGPMGINKEYTRYVDCQPLIKNLPTNSQPGFSERANDYQLKASLTDSITEKATQRLAVLSVDPVRSTETSTSSVEPLTPKLSSCIYAGESKG